MGQLMTMLWARRLFIFSMIGSCRGEPECRGILCRTSTGMTPRLTVTGGVRSDPFTPIVTADRQIDLLDPRGQSTVFANVPKGLNLPATPDAARQARATRRLTFSPDRRCLRSIWQGQDLDPRRIWRLLHAGAIAGDAGHVESALDQKLPIYTALHEHR